MKVLNIALLCLLFGNVSLADDSCVAGEARQLFSKEAKTLKNYKVVTHDKTRNYIEETFELADGTIVKTGNGGCAHFDRSVTFKIKRIPTKGERFEAKVWLTRASELLAKLPAESTIGKEISSYLREHEKKILEQKPIKTEAGYQIEATDTDGFNTVHLKVSEGSEMTELSASVNTAL